MAKNKKPKKPHRPMSRGRLLAACMLPITNRKPIKDAHDYCIDNGWLAYYHMTQTPNEDDYVVLLQVCNEVTVLLNMGYGENIPEIAQAYQGLLRILKRSRETGSYAMDAELMPAIRGTIWMWEKQYKEAPLKAIKAARILLKDLEHETPEGEARIADIQPVRRQIVKTKNGGTRLAEV